MAAVLALAVSAVPIGATSLLPDGDEIADADQVASASGDAPSASWVRR
ncbi:hypothetical protein ACFVH0_16725 [Streptomyces sp. NPDC127117]